jgi:hypothetical protein
VKAQGVGSAFVVLVSRFGFKIYKTKSSINLTAGDLAAADRPDLTTGRALKKKRQK